MARYDLRIKARELRKQGVSVKQIAAQLGVSKSTVSVWVRDIVLTVEQMIELKGAAIKGAELGRLRSASLKREKRLQLIKSYEEKGIKELSGLSKREFLIAGLALYWGEGSKKSRTLEFCNSDPKMIKFLVSWLKVNFKVSTEELRCRIGINELHKDREESVKQFWSEVSGVPLSQFQQTSFKIARNNKVYSNFNEHYGTLAVRVLKSTQYFYPMMGLLEGLHEAGMKLGFRDVS